MFGDASGFTRSVLSWPFKLVIVTIGLFFCLP
jgi:hypothetical protein